MRIRMLKLAAGPAGVRSIGAELTVAEAEGLALIDSGAAELIPGPAEEAPTEIADAARPATEERPRHGKQGRKRDPGPTNDADAGNPAHN